MDDPKKPFDAKVWKIRLFAGALLLLFLSVCSFSSVHRYPRAKKES